MCGYLIRERDANKFFSKLTKVLGVPSPAEKLVGFDFSPALRSLAIQSFHSDFIANDLSIIADGKDLRRIIKNANQLVTWLH